MDQRNNILSQSLAQLAWIGFLATGFLLPWMLGGNSPFAATWALAVGILLLPTAAIGSQHRGKIPVLILACVGLWVYAWGPLAGTFFPSVSTWIPQFSPAQTAERLPELLLPIVFLALGALLMDRPQRVEWFLGLLVANGALLSLVGIAQRLAWNGKIFWIYELVEGGKPFATWVNRNNAGSWLLIALAAGLFFVVRHSIRDASSVGDLATGIQFGKKSWLQRKIRSLVVQFTMVDTRHLYALAGMAVVLVGVIASLSRGAYVSLFAFMLVAVGLLLFSRHSAAFGVVFSLIVALGLVVWTEQLDTVAQRAGTLVELEDASAARLDHWTDSLPMLQQHWRLGSGLGTWKLLYPPLESGPFVKWFEHAENQYLEVLCELGIPGLALVLFGVWLVLALAVRLMRRTESTGRALGVMLLSAMAAQLVMACVDFGLFLPANSVALASLIACGIGYENYAGRMASLGQKSTSQLLAVGCRWSMILFLVVAGVWCVRETYAVDLRDMASRGISRIDRATDPASLELILRRLEDSLAVRPNDGFAHFELGRYWSARFRLEEFRRLQSDPVDPDFLIQTGSESYSSANPQTSTRMDFDAVWMATSPEWLRDNLKMELEGVPVGERAGFAESLMPDFLKKSLLEFRKADELCPFVSRFRLERTRLEFLMTGDEQLERRLVDETIALCPNDVEALFHSGLLLVQSEDRAAGARLWGHCMTLSRIHDREIIQASKQMLTLGEFLELVLPDDPNFLLFVARKYFAEPQDQLLKLMVVNHTVQVVERSQAEPSTKNAWLAETDFLAGRFQLAHDRFSNLLNNDPGRVEWRVRQAQSLGELGDLETAIQQLMICQQHPQSDQRLVERLLRQYRRQRQNN